MRHDPLVAKSGKQKSPLRATHQHFLRLCLGFQNFAQVKIFGCVGSNLCTETGMGERSTATTRPGPRLVEGLSKDSGALKDIVPSLFPGPSSPPTGPGLSKLEGLQEKA